MVFHFISVPITAALILSWKSTTALKNTKYLRQRTNSRINGPERKLFGEVLSEETGETQLDLREFSWITETNAVSSTDDDEKVISTNLSTILPSTTVSSSSGTLGNIITGSTSGNIGHSSVSTTVWQLPTTSNMGSSPSVTSEFSTFPSTTATSSMDVSTAFGFSFTATGMEMTTSSSSPTSTGTIGMILGESALDNADISSTSPTDVTMTSSLSSFGTIGSTAIGTTLDNSDGPSISTINFEQPSSTNEATVENASSTMQSASSSLSMMTSTSTDFSITSSTNTATSGKNDDLLSSTNIGSTSTSISLNGVDDEVLIVTLPTMMTSSTNNGSTSTTVSLNEVDDDALISTLPTMLTSFTNIGSISATISLNGENDDTLIVTSPTLIENSVNVENNDDALTPTSPTEKVFTVTPSEDSSASAICINDLECPDALVCLDKSNGTCIFPPCGRCHDAKSIMDLIITFSTIESNEAGIDVLTTSMSMQDITMSIKEISMSIPISISNALHPSAFSGYEEILSCNDHEDCGAIEGCCLSDGLCHAKTTAMPICWTMVETLP